MARFDRKHWHSQTEIATFCRNTTNDLQADALSEKLPTWMSSLLYADYQLFASIDCWAKGDANIVTINCFEWLITLFIIPITPYD